MDWSQVATIVGANLGLFLWSVRQARTDFHQSLRMIESIQMEIKDFHGRLCAIEQRFVDDKKVHKMDQELESTTCYYRDR